MENKKWYNVEINIETRTMLDRAEKFKAWLYDESIKFETSGNFNMLHFEVLLSQSEVEKVNTALDKIVWFDSICSI